MADQETSTSSPRPRVSLCLLGIVSALILLSGCSSPHGGPIVLYWVSSAAGAVIPRPESYVSGTDGTTLKTALTIHHCSKDSLIMLEDEWLSEKYRTKLPPQAAKPALDTWPLDSGPHPSIFQHSTARIGRKVYDIVVITLLNGDKVTTYFDVTFYKMYYPKDDPTPPRSPKDKEQNIF